MLLLFADPKAPAVLPLYDISITEDELPGFTPATPHLRHSVPLPPSYLAHPGDYLHLLDSQMGSISLLGNLADWRSYLSGHSLLPYARSVAANLVATIDNPYRELAQVDQQEGIWRSIADGVSHIL